MKLFLFDNAGGAAVVPALCLAWSALVFEILGMGGSSMTGGALRRKYILPTKLLFFQLQKDGAL
jgi:hypothetical protein